jgi:uncharacterized protein (TIGR00730 family)
VHKHSSSRHKKKELYKEGNMKTRSNLVALLRALVNLFIGPRLNLSLREHARTCVHELIAGYIKLAEVRKPMVTFFGSARFDPDAHACRCAEQLAQTLSDAGYAVLAGGGPGTMAAANKGAAGGVSIGVNIKLSREEAPNPHQNVSLYHKVLDIRAHMLTHFTNAGFVVLPGGYGTLQELTLVLCLIQTGIHAGAPVILFGSKFWQPFERFLRESLLAEGCICEEDLSLFYITDIVEDAFARIEQRQHVHNCAA